MRLWGLRFQSIEVFCHLFSGAKGDKATCRHSAIVECSKNHSWVECACADRMAIAFFHGGQGTPSLHSHSQVIPALVSFLSISFLIRFATENFDHLCLLLNDSNLVLTTYNEDFVIQKQRLASHLCLQNPANQAKCTKSNT